MTDNEIIKAMECCSQKHNCRECVLWEMHSAQCVSDLLSNALSLINRQKAEIEKKDIEIDILLWKKETLSDEISDLNVKIERLKAEADMAEGYADALEERARTEAIKEFAERLKELTVIGTIRKYSDANGISYHLEDMVSEDIDNLEKEMTEDEGK